jgi:hypothetical protein
MGRGRSKAKHTKVARDLKYSSNEIDIESLTQELHGVIKWENSKEKEESHPSEKD